MDGGMGQVTLCRCRLRVRQDSCHCCCAQMPAGRPVYQLVGACLWERLKNYPVLWYPWAGGMRATQKQGLHE